MTECKYRGRVIGWMVAENGGNLVYASVRDYTPIRTKHLGTILVRHMPPWVAW